MWFVFSSLQTNTSKQPQSELSDRGRGHHLIHRYSFVYHSHQKSTSCDCIVQYHSLAYCTGILSLLWHHSCQDGSSVSNLWQTHTPTKDGRITIHTFTFLAFIFVYTPVYKLPPITPLRFVLRLRLQKGGRICGTLRYILLCMHAGPKRLEASSWSADIGIGGPYNSPGLHHCGGSSRTSHGYSSPQQRKPQGGRGGRLIHVTPNSPICQLPNLPNKHGHRNLYFILKNLNVNFVANSIGLMFQLRKSLL